MATTNQKLKNCEVCGAEKAKYTCPKCEVRTCSLTCVNVHKNELKCDGIRNKTKYKPLKSFTDLDLLSDYRLLEQVGRSIDICKRNPENKYTLRQTTLPIHLRKLKSAAYYRKITLLFMPQNFSRHKINTTYLNWKTNELFWRIEWIFPQAENTKWNVERNLDSTRLSTLVEQVFDPISVLENKVEIEDLNIKMNLAERLQFYRAAGLNNIKILLKAEKIKKSHNKFYDLDITLTLSENLENKTIIEFPTLYVVIKDHFYMYEIVETDEETSDTECKNHVARKRKFNNNSSDAAKKKNGPINYFFNDFSDSEDEKINNRLDTNKHSFDLNKLKKDKT